jgi:hypothetical protein
MALACGIKDGTQWALAQKSVTFWLKPIVIDV